MTGMTWDSWVTDVTGKTVGPGDSYGECVGLAYDYVTRCIGSNFISTNYGPHSGYAIGSWDSGLVPAGMTRIPGSNVKKGDVVFLNYGVLPFYATSHVMIATGAPIGFMCPVLSQNSPQRWVAGDQLPLEGCAGVWRPTGDKSIPDTNPWDTTIPAPPDIAGGIANGIAGIAGTLQGITAFTDTVNKLSTALSKPQFWQRLGLFLLGATLLYIAVMKILSESEVVTDTMKGLTT